MVTVFFLQSCSNNNSKAQEYANSRDYKAFYNEIEQDIKDGDNQTKNLLIDYLFKDIQDGNTEAVQYYLEKQPNLINVVDTEGNRAIDVVLFDETINITMLKILLQYNPHLNYIVQYYDMSPLQVIVSGKYDNTETLELLLKHGADVNFVGNSNRSKNTPLILSYVTDKIDIFSILLKAGAKLNKHSKRNNIFATITASYSLYLKQQGIDLSAFYSEPISKNFLKTISTLDYKEIHNKNMQYLQRIVKNRNKTVDISNAVISLIKWFIKTNNSYGLKYILKNKLCTNYKVCTKMKSFAIKNNNRVALHLLNENYL